MESQVMYYGGPLPARVVLESAEAAHLYRTFVETVTDDKKPGVQYARYFNGEEEALADYNGRLGKCVHEPAAIVIPS
jgi:hypothetical protein